MAQANTGPGNTPLPDENPITGATGGGTKPPLGSTYGRQYGDIYGPVGQATYVNGPQEPAPEDPETEAPFQPIMPNINLGDIGINPDDYNPTTREVTDDELVENRLTDLLQSDSEYIRQARLSGQRAAAQRGALSSSVFAGSAERAAIQSAMPIATQDAQTYYRTAAENMAAKNNMTLAKLQSATSLAQSRIGAGATLGAASISANAQLQLKEMDNHIRKDLFQLGAEHDTVMEQLRQDGRVELSELNFYQQRRLEEMGFDYSVELTELNHQQRMEIEETFANPRFYANLDMQRVNSMSNILMQMSSMYSNGINSMNMADIDESAFQRGESFYSQMFEFMFDFNNSLWGDEFPDIATAGPNQQEEGGG